MENSTSETTQVPVEETSSLIEETGPSTVEETGPSAVEETVRKLATIAKIEEIKPIIGCDNIEYVRVRQWWIIVKKADNLKMGDLCVYVEIDSILPKRPEFAFLAKQNYRIKTMKMRGVYSQGIIFPLSILPPRDTPYLEHENVTIILGILKYITSDESYVYSYRKKNKSYGNFPRFIPKTDEERVQNIWGTDLKKFREANPNTSCYVSEKLDGMSTTVALYNGEYVVCSRNFIVEPGSIWFDICQEMGMEEKLRSLNKNVAFQGELIGPKSNGNIYKLNKHSLRFFSIYLIDEQRYRSYPEMIDTCSQLGLMTVPIIHTCYIIPDNYDEFIATVDNGNSTLGKILEGYVYVFTTQTGNQRFSFKAISKKYSLKHG